MRKAVELEADEEIIALVRPAAVFLLWHTFKVLLFAFFVVVISIPMLQSGVLMLTVYAFLAFLATRNLIALVALFKGQMLIITTKRIVDTYVSGLRLQATDLMFVDIIDVKMKKHKDFPLSLFGLNKVKICGSSEKGFDIILRGQNKAEDIVSLIKELASLK